MTLTVAPEPIWSLERRESGHFIWRRDASKVKFRCDVEVLEYEKDPEEYSSHLNNERQRKPNAVIVYVTCVAALAVTVILPWFFLGP